MNEAVSETRLIIVRLFNRKIDRIQIRMMRQVPFRHDRMVDHDQDPQCKVETAMTQSLMVSLRYEEDGRKMSRIRVASVCSMSGSGRSGFVS